jgi:glycosyltransferase involved in cell wall biosynthesis
MEIPPEENSRAKGIVPQLIVIHKDFDVGGAEHVLLNLVNYFASQRVHVEFVTSMNGGLTDRLDPRVKITILPLRGSAIRQLFTLSSYLLERRDAGIVFSTESFTNLLTVYACRITRHPGRVIIRQASSNINEQFGNIESLTKLRLVTALYRKAYRSASLIIANSPGTHASLARFGAYVDERKCVTILNPVDIDHIRNAAEISDGADHVDSSSRYICAIVRLEEQKRPADLLYVLDVVRKTHEDVKLIVYGEGTQRTKLEELARLLNLTKHVKFAGKVKNPYHVLRRSKLLLLTSSYEGFGMVLVEALALGVAVVSSELNDGPRQILGGGLYGQLVPVGDIAGFAAAVCKILDSPPDPRVLNARAEAFRVDIIAKQYATAMQLDLEPNTPRKG